MHVIIIIIILKIKILNIFGIKSFKYIFNVKYSGLKKTIKTFIFLYANKLNDE